MLCSFVAIRVLPVRVIPCDGGRTILGKRSGKKVKVFAPSYKKCSYWTLITGRGM